MSSPPCWEKTPGSPGSAPLPGRDGPGRTPRGCPHLHGPVFRGRLVDDVDLAVDVGQLHVLALVHQEQLQRVRGGPQDGVRAGAEPVGVEHLATAVLPHGRHPEERRAVRGRPRVPAPWEHGEPTWPGRGAWWGCPQGEPTWPGRGAWWGRRGSRTRSRPPPGSRSRCRRVGNNPSCRRSAGARGRLRTPASPGWGPSPSPGWVPPFWPHLDGLPHLDGFSHPRDPTLASAGWVPPSMRSNSGLTWMGP